MEQTLEDRNAIEAQRQIQVCKDYLKDKTITKNMSRRVKNVTIKQTIEQSLHTYVSKDAVNAALIELGIPHKLIPGTDYYYVALSYKDL